MSNTYFQFKQFIIHQHRCAMKVCTDACLFAAWTCHFINKNKITSNNILDIGAGTGLISLMLAQEIAVTIDCIELDQDAFEQCSENISNSPFRNNINIYHTPVQQFTSPITGGYDFIISNPPFFEQDLKSKNAARNKALHDDSLTLTELMTAVNKLITPTGKFAILLPYHRMDKWMQICEANNWYIQACCKVKQTEKHDFFRTILIMCKERMTPTSTEIAIKIDGVYSIEFEKLLSPYYLAFK